MRGLRALPEHGDFVDGAMLVGASLAVARAHHQRMNHRIVRGGDTLDQIVLGKVVHQEADRAAVHAVDRLAGIHELVQGLQHQPVAAERDNDVGGFRLDVAVAFFQACACLARLGRRSRNEGDLLGATGAHRNLRLRMILSENRFPLFGIMR